MQRIFINLASLLDSELIPTIVSALKRAADPKSLFFSIVVQDSNDPKEKIEEIINSYGAKMSYKFLELKEVRGVGYARALANQELTSDYEYYLQIDSHSRFAKEWDIDLIAAYNQEGWDNECRFVYSTYPRHYGYVSDFAKLPDNLITDDNNTIYITTDKELNPSHINKVNIDPETRSHTVCPILWEDDFTTRTTQYICAGFIFARSEYILEVPTDPNYSYTGEEISYSIRFFARDILIVTPPLIPVWHDFHGQDKFRRANFFTDQKGFLFLEKEQVDWLSLEKKSVTYLEEFMYGKLPEPFGVTEEIILQYIDKFSVEKELSSTYANLVDHDNDKMLPLGQAHT